MKLSARLFNCARCHCQIIICSPCDRNNIYCESICSRAARSQSCALASKRYQKSHRGQLKHAERQRRYRVRQKNKVTHHSSPVLTVHAVLPPQPNERIVEAESGHLHCHFCKRTCSPFLRRDYLRHSVRSSRLHSSIWPLAP